MEMSANSENKTTIQRYETYLLAALAIGLAVFHVLLGFGVIVLSGYAQAAIHWMFVASYFIISKPWKFKGGRILDLVLVAGVIIAACTLLYVYPQLSIRPGIYTQFELTMAVISVVVGIILGFRSLGKALPLICIIMLTYTMFGSNLPGMLKTTRMTIARLAPYLFIGTEGTYGTALITCAKFIYLFVLFGAILDLTGAGEFFVRLAYTALGHVRGGPAQAAVYSSMLMGMVSGSGPANVVTTGTFTIPLMKRSGFDANMAGAVEAVASNGGQIMPPVMGAVAFLMSEATGIPYSEICLAALVPAILYYLTLSTCIASYAHRNNLPASKEKGETLGQVVKSGWFYFLPIVTIVALLMMGYSAHRCAVVSIVVSMVIGFVADREKMTLQNIVKALMGAANGMGSVVVACFLAGIVTGCINITGLGLKISMIIQALSGGNLFIMLVLTMVVCLILGMGLPTSAAYIILAVMIAPVIVDAGVTKLAAHLFILYFGTISNLTPPVALAVFAACSISGGTMWRTGGQSMKLAATALVVPFIFVYSNELLLIGETGDIIFALVTALIGCIVMGLALFGWGFRNLNAVERIILLPCSVMLILPKPLIANLIGGGISLVILGLAFIQSRRVHSVVQTDE